MPLLRRKPVLLHPLPSLSSILQSPHAPTAPTGSIAAPTDSSSFANSTVHVPPPSKGKKPRASSPPSALSSGADPLNGVPPLDWTPLDGSTDAEQLDKLSRLFSAELSAGSTSVMTKGRKREDVRLVGRDKLGGLVAGIEGEAVKIEGDGVKMEDGHVNGINEASKQGMPGKGKDKASAAEEWKVWDREVWYLPETGEIFLDYESFVTRRLFLEQPQFQCEISAKSTLSYTAALQSERKETELLHSRFPRGVKRAVLAAGQFQVEGKLDNLADKIFERFANRFFDNETLFVDLEGDKYLARITRTFPPKSLASRLSSASGKLKYPLKPGITPTTMHPLAVDLNMDSETVDEVDDPMGYFYHVRIITETDPEAEAEGEKGVGGGAAKVSNGTEERIEGDDGEGEAKWGGSTMEVKADQLSRDRINFSRSILRRFLRDCLLRDSAVYSPWIVKPAVAARNGIPSDMPDSVRRQIADFKQGQMDKRKRDRDERLGLLQLGEDEEEEKPDVKKRKRNGVAGKGKDREMDSAERKREEEEEEERKRVEDEKRRKRFHKYCLDDLIVEYKADKDAPAGRIGLRPAPKTDLPFSDDFEQLLMTWSFLNVMGEPLHISPFSLDEFETALYHSDPATPSTLLTEIHAVMLNCLADDLAAGHPAVRPLGHTERTDEGSINGDHISDSDYWEGFKGATTETLRPIAQPLAVSWSTFTIPPAPPGPSSAANASANRKGWQDSLIGCLWERASLDTLPGYLDDILHMLFEPKPPPTRPTWSTAPPASGPAADLLPARPEKRYWTLHHKSKLAILAWLCELVAQTEAVREYMEESVARTTEVRKEQLDVKRELKRVIAALEELEPKPKTGEDGEGTSEAKNGLSRSPSVSLGPRHSANGNGAEHSEMDLDSAIGDDLESASRASSPISEADGPAHAHAAASRRKALAAAAAERSAHAAERKATQAKEAAAAKEKRAETKQQAAEKKKLQEEAEGYSRRLTELNYAFRSSYYTLRSQPLGMDRFGNKIWWFDGIGSAPVRGPDGKLILGTGRLYLQGPDKHESETLRLQGIAALSAFWSAGITEDKWPKAKEREELERKDQRDAAEQLSIENYTARRDREEGPNGQLEPGQWGFYDAPEELEGFVAYLNPRGIKEAALLKVMGTWKRDMIEGMQKRRVNAGVAEPGKEERGIRTRKGAEGEGMGNWKNKRAL